VLSCPDCSINQYELVFWQNNPDLVTEFQSLKEHAIRRRAKNARLQRERMELERLERRATRWREICPPLYRQTDPSLLPDQFSLAKVLEWQLNPKGILIVGPARTGKTRMAWLLLQRLHQDGIRISAVSSITFGHECSRRFFDGTGEGWIDGLAEAPILFFDDLGKMKLTERVESELFGLINTRIEWERPIIATSNMTDDEMLAKMTPDRGMPLVARLREFCDVVITGR
jgi:DNA replication protein DnaC